MCGRYGLTREPWEFVKRMSGTLGSELEFQPRFNLAPTDPALALLNDDDRSVRMMRWGLIPRWAKDPASFRMTTFNARIETIATAPVYRDCTRFRRCIVVADGFYEWRKNEDGTKTPFWIHRADGEPFGFAGLWDVWRRGDRVIPSCTIVTAPANAFMTPVHSRMPVALADDAVAEWLDPKPLDADAVYDRLFPSEATPVWEMYPVSSRVGNVRNDDPTLVERGAV